MLEWMILPFKRYADFSGRSRRMEFWSFVLLNAIVYTILIGLMIAGGFPMMAAMSDPAMSDPSAIMAEGPGALFYIGAGLLVIYGLAIFIPNIAVVVRRLHDRDMSGWWYLGVIVASMIPLVGFVAGIAFLVLMLLPGTPGPNRFGPDPKDPANAEVFA
jgi:uncharacterized membrane protein YhaH (DUF805 family)